MTDDLYTRWLDIPPGQRPPAPHVLLNLPEDVIDARQIDEAASRQLQTLDQYAAHRDPGVRESCAKMMNEVARARNLLTNRLARSEPASPAFAFQGSFGEGLSRRTRTARQTLWRLVPQRGRGEILSRRTMGMVIFSMIAVAALALLTQVWLAGPPDETDPSPYQAGRQLESDRPVVRPKPTSDAPDLDAKDEDADEMEDRVFQKMMQEPISVRDDAGNFARVGGDGVEQRRFKTLADAGNFALVGGDGVEQRRFKTLADAVLHSNHGDIIKVRGDGPFVSDGVTVRHPLVIRAADGWRPSIILSQDSADKNIPLILATASLVLEGLELRRIGGASGPLDGRFPHLVRASHDAGSLYVANCRLVMENTDVASTISTGVPVWIVRNCEFVAKGAIAAAWVITRSGGRRTIENCVSIGGGLDISLWEPVVSDVEIEFRNNTFVGPCIALTLRTLPSRPNLEQPPESVPPLRLDFSGNVTYCPPPPATWRGILFFHQFSLQSPLSASDAEALLPRLVDLHERHNTYLSGTRMLRLAVDDKSIEGTRGKDLADWNRLWEQSDTGSVEGPVRFEGGNLIQRLRSAGDEFTPDDFRLQPGSAGYRAGPDGEDLGANIDLVGPGEAYERWQQTPEYQEWLQETRP